MSSVDTDAVRGALREVFLELTRDRIDPSLIVWENRPKEENPTGLQIEEQFQVFFERSSFGRFEANGRELFALSVPVGSGTDTAARTAQAIVDAFEPVYAINRQSVDFYVDRVERGTGGREGARWFVPVSIYWRAYANRSPLLVRK